MIFVAFTMPTITHILVDFENVQPGAADIALLRGEGLRLAIFRGPGQMKYAADLAEAWQPLGTSVQFVRCAKAGRNAVDMHIAFHLGTLIDAHRQSGGGGALRLVVVSRDTDFDPLLMYIRGQGYDATRAASIKAAVDAAGSAAAAPRAARARGRAPAAKAVQPAKAAQAAKAATKTAQPAKAPAKKAAAKKAPAKKTATTAPAARPPAPHAAARTATRKPAATRSAPDALARVIDSLRQMGDKCPKKRKGLEGHIESHLGRNLAAGELAALIDELQRRNIVTFTDNKVAYRLPPAEGR